MTRYCCLKPIAASSVCVRAASRRAECWARATSTKRVRRSSANASTAALVLRALLFQAGQRPEAGGVALAGLEKAAPRAGQLQQADGMAGRGGVENDVVVIGGQRRDRSSSAVNSSKAAISVVQAPESCSSMPFTTASGSTPRTGPTMRSR